MALADLLAKCLSENPADRYATTSAVAADLRRHLADLPLRGVANRSAAERWRKWRRRRPLALPLIGLFAVVAAAGVGVLAHVGRQAEQTRASLRLGTDYLQSGRYQEALETLKTGAALVDGMPYRGELVAQLQDRRRQAEAGLAARGLHDLCESAFGRCMPRRICRNHQCGLSNRAVATSGAAAFS